jgi:hypothetical protein
MSAKMRREQWTLEKCLGKMDKSHRDYKRQYKLNYKHMKRLNKQKNFPNYEQYLDCASRLSIFLRCILLPWKWKLQWIAPDKVITTWQWIARERYGKSRITILQTNIAREQMLK